MAYLITADGRKTAITPKNGKDFKWEELKEMIGGYIEIVRLRDGRILVVDEEGQCKGLEMNVEASVIAGQMIVGNVVLCKDNQVL